MRHAREALDKANAPTADPANRERWGLILASLMTGVLEEAEVLHQQLANATQVAEDAFQEAARLQQELAEARAGGWVPVGERLPEATVKILVCNAKGRINVGKFLPGNEFVPYAHIAVEGRYYNPEDFTLWQPLSPAPAQTPPPATPEAREAGGEEGGEAA